MSYNETLLNVCWEDLPAPVHLQAKRCLKDIIATAAGSLALPSCRQAEAVVTAQYGPGDVPLWFRGKGSSFVGAALYNALAIDSLDCHDGFRPNKGHVGATVVPVVLGACAGRDVPGKELLAAIVMGYEIACRAGLVIHPLYAPAYHASGSWAALGAAAAAARIMCVPADSIDNVVGIAEYYAPMSPMLRCTKHPAFVKDAAGAGAWAAAMALAMQQCGIRGLPSLFVTEPRGREQIESLGEDWMILRQYFKPYPTCRWAQPVVEGALYLQREYGFTTREIERIDVDTFDVAADLVTFPPEDSDAAQYSTPWAVAAMLVDGKLGVDQIHPDRLTDPEIIELGKRVKTHVDKEIQACFPEKCLARVMIGLKDGRVFRGPTLSARGDYSASLDKQELTAKFQALLGHRLGEGAVSKLGEVLESLENRPADHLLGLLSQRETDRD
ncbi:MAG TPA: 2-methylcitrate dehydratase [Planctomycetaceae bacterium]|nr:2-methylcitrate dehydratase [Planctomycetaceae bacterium]